MSKNVFILLIITGFSIVSGTTKEIGDMTKESDINIVREDSTDITIETETKVENQKIKMHLFCYAIWR